MSSAGVLVFPNARELYGGISVTQETEENLVSGNSGQSKAHEPLKFVTGTSKSRNRFWSTADKEGFTIVSTFKRRDSLVWDGADSFYDHWNTAYIMSPTACVSTLSTTIAQMLRHWRKLLDAIQHIPGVRSQMGRLAIAMAVGRSAGQP